MQTIIVSNISINGIERDVKFTQLSDDIYEISSDKQPTLRIKPYQGVFPLLADKYCVTHEHGIVLGKTPAEVFEKAIKKYWDNKQIALR